ncbi:MAG: hypothetical protein QM758_24890 [Armatimonas sp.]
MPQKQIGWQGMTLEVPEGWEVTGFSGDYKEGYLRIDDGESQSCELKWGSWDKREKKEPDVEVRAESYLGTLERTAKKKKQSLTGKLTTPPKGAVRPERLITGFAFTGENRAAGISLYCKESHRVLIAQVQGATAKIAEAVLASIEVRDAVEGWRRWALYDLCCDVPSDFLLSTQQVMNVYMMLSFARGCERLTIEQWGVADVARKDSYLDIWMSMNTKGELGLMKVDANEVEGGVHGHDAIHFEGRPQIGLPLWNALKESLRQFKAPALRFMAYAWECPEGNKLYLVQHTRTRKAADLAEVAAKRVYCHGGVA